MIRVLIADVECECQLLAACVDAVVTISRLQEGDGDED